MEGVKITLNFANMLEVKKVLKLGMSKNRKKVLTSFMKIANIEKCTFSEKSTQNFLSAHVFD